MKGVKTSMRQIFTRYALVCRVFYCRSFKIPLKRAGNDLAPVMPISKFASAVRVQFRNARWLTGAVLLLVAVAAPAQNLFVSSISQSTIYEVTPGGTVSTFVTGIPDPAYMAFNSAGDLFVGSFNSIYEITPGGKTNVIATGISDLGGLAINSAGDLFVGTAANITEITPAGVKSVFTTGVSGASGLAINGGGYMFAASGETIWEVSPTGGTATSFASIPSDSRQLIFGNAGLLLANQTDDEVLGFNPNGLESVFVPDINGAYGLAIQPVPEPSALGLLAAGMMMWLARKR
jgi:hypothetical protein